MSTGRLVQHSGGRMRNPGHAGANLWPECLTLDPKPHCAGQVSAAGIWRRSNAHTGILVEEAWVAGSDLEGYWVGHAEWIPASATVTTSPPAPHCAPLPYKTP